MATEEPISPVSLHDVTFLEKPNQTVDSSVKLRMSADDTSNPAVAPDSPARASTPQTIAVLVSSTVTDRHSDQEQPDTLSSYSDLDKSVDHISSPAEDSPDAVAGAEATDEEDKTVGSQELTRAQADKQMAVRLAASIRKASAANLASSTDTANTSNDQLQRRWITVAFGQSAYYVVPWSACCTWAIFEVLLNEWYHDNEAALNDIKHGNFTVELRDRGYIDPSTWELVVDNVAVVHVWPHSEYSKDQESDSESEDQAQTPEYENRIQYQVNYFYKGNERNYLLGTDYSDKPVEFEVTEDYESLPALVEIKEVVKPQHESRIRDEEKDGKKTKLGPLDRISSTLLKINSSYLLNVIRSVVDYTDPEGNTGVDLSDGSFYYPYRVLFHHVDALTDYQKDQAGLRAKHTDAFNKKCDEHIDLLIGYLYSQSNVALKQCQLQWENKNPVTSFATCWLLLRPGEDVYVREDDGSLNAYILGEIEGGVTEEDGKKTNKDYAIMVWNLAFDGEEINPSIRDINIGVFDNEREVTSLDVFPSRFLDRNDKNVTKDRLIARGKKYLEYSRHPSFLQYTGKGLGHESRTYTKARVIVEHTSRPWFNDQQPVVDRDDHHRPIRCTHEVRQTVRVPHCECAHCKTAIDTQQTYDRERFHSYYNIVPQEAKDLTSHHFLLMASHMFAFVLKDRFYDLVDVAGLEPPKMAETAIQNLVLPSSTKTLIQAVASTYTDREQSKRFSADFIHGKGEGQIILLHGPPGTGKTLTAESVAEYTRRPLLSITAADLGHEPDALEHSLLKYFKRASDWDAIVLLDESDVYLEQRTTQDLKRNSIVSVFLRALDYFQGILFLTTNRVGHFDEAFMSRIHLSIGYEKLDDSARVQIWNNLFLKLKDDAQYGGPNIDYEYDAKGYVKSKEVQSLGWNGREIRNAFQTAVALAVYDFKHNKPTDGANEGETAPKVKESHLMQVVAMSAAFRKYMVATHQGFDDSTWAYRHGNREDTVPSTPAKQAR